MSTDEKNPSTWPADVREAARNAIHAKRFTGVGCDVLPMEKEDVRYCGELADAALAVITPFALAREQAAAVAMREAAAHLLVAIDAKLAGRSIEPGGLRLIGEELRALPLPTDALDTMLAALTAERDEWLRGAEDRERLLQAVLAERDALRADNEHAAKSFEAAYQPAIKARDEAMAERDAARAEGMREAAGIAEAYPASAHGNMAGNPEEAARDAANEIAAAILAAIPETAP